MAGPASWKGAVQFGPLLSFNVRAKSAVRETKFAFNQHHADEACHGRARMGGMVCEGCGEQLAKDQIVRGYNGVAGIDEDYLTSLELEATQVMTLDGLVPAESIDPRYFQKSYDVIPEKGAEKPYKLFLTVLQQSAKVAVGKVVAGGKEFIVTLRPRDGVLAMELMFWPEEVEATGTNAEATMAIANVTLSDAEVGMGMQLVKYLQRDFEPTTYANEYASSVATYLDQFTAGQQPTPIKRTAVKSSTGSLEDQLTAALAALGGQAEAKVASRKAPKVKAA